MPVPAARAPWYCSTVSISTIPTCCAAVAAVVVPVDEPSADPGAVGEPPVPSEEPSDRRRSRRGRP